MARVPGKHFVAVLVALATVTGCVGSSSSGSGVVRSYVGVPRDAVDPATRGSRYAVRDSNGHLLVVTFESSTCPVHVAQVRSIGTNGVRVDLSSTRGKTCTADARMRTSVLEPPAGVDLAERTTVQIEAVKQVLPAR